MALVTTPHINADKEAFGKTVLMPGDPLRSKFIAENFLENAVLVNNIRGIQGYTGTYQGTKVSVMASGMGMPTIGIYSYELFNFFDVENIIRIGSTGAMQEKVKVRDIVFGMGACTNSNYASQYNLGGTFARLQAIRCSRRQLHRQISWGHPIMWAISFRQIPFTTMTSLRAKDGRKWVFSVLRWKRRRCT